MKPCTRCGGVRLKWVGFTQRALKRIAFRPSPDIEGCQGCGHAWYYTGSGRRRSTKVYCPIEDLHSRPI